MQIQDWSELPIANEIHNQTDRAAAILAAAYLEDKLNVALRERLVTHKDLKDTFRRLFKPGAPISSFATKGEFGYLLRFYGRTMRNNILLVTDIRNDFAHLSEVMDFTHASVSEKCNKLNLRATLLEPLMEHLPPRPRPLSREHARMEFIETVSLASTMLTAIAKGPEFKCPV